MSNLDGVPRSQRPVWIMDQNGMPIKVERGTKYPKRILCWCHEGDTYWRRFNMEVYLRELRKLMPRRKRKGKRKKKKVEVNHNEFHGRASKEDFQVQVDVYGGRTNSHDSQGGTYS